MAFRTEKISHSAFQFTFHSSWGATDKFHVLFGGNKIFLKLTNSTSKMGGAYFRGTLHPSFWGHNCKTFCIADNAVEHRWIGSCPRVFFSSKKKSKWSRWSKNGGVLPVWWIIQITSDDKNLSYNLTCMLPVFFIFTFFWSANLEIHRLAE